MSIWLAINYKTDFKITTTFNIGGGKETCLIVQGLVYMDHTFRVYDRACGRKYFSDQERIHYSTALQLVVTGLVQQCEAVSILWYCRVHGLVTAAPNISASDQQ